MSRCSLFATAMLATRKMPRGVSMGMLMSGMRMRHSIRSDERQWRGTYGG